MAVEELLKKVEKDLGKGVLTRYGDDRDDTVEIIPTGSPSLDKILGIGGVPKGRILEVYGPESSGKTTLALHIMAEAQKLGDTVAFIDVEHALDPTYAENLGVNMDDVLMSQPDSAEQALEVVDTIIRSGEVSLIVLDSVAALAPRAELDGEMGDAFVAITARLMSSALKQFTHTTSQNKCSVLFINQLRAKIGSFGYGPTEGTTGGRSLPYYASVRMDIRRIGSIKDGENIVGNKTKIKVVKNKCGAPYKEVEIDLIFGEGFSKESELLDLALKDGTIRQKGSWFSFNDKNFAQGKENARKALKDETFYNQVAEEIG